LDDEEVSVNDDARGLELRTLLGKCRARLRPRDVGLPLTGRRRVTGLRREEVAELVGVSPNWYALFESGSNDRRFSAAFVQRVADALRLDERERALLFRLALPEIRIAVEQFERSAYDGALRNLRGVRAMVRRVTTATSFAEAAQSAVEAVIDVLAPSSCAVAILVPQHALRVLAAGPRAGADLERSVVADTCLVANYPNRFGYTTFSENRAPYGSTLRGAFDFEQRTSDGNEFLVTVDPGSPTAHEALAATESSLVSSGALADARLNSREYWEWNSKLEVSSTITHGLFTDGRYQGNLCALWTEARAMAPLDVEILRTACAIVELAAAPGGGRPR
jgi:transcriptional regulator with XRE-family HTH domain